MLLNRTIRLAMGLLVWMLALYGLLAIRHVPGDLGHWICGPWGCGPPLQALVAYHGFWSLLLGPPFLLLAGSWTAARQRSAADALLSVAALGVAGVALWQAAFWVPTDFGSWRYFLPRCLFVTVTAVDLPIIPLALVGAVTRLLAGRRASRRPDRAIAEKTDLPSPVHSE